ncbi:hypothetical protein DPMN_061901 [Dreissena polymorpha]|uniref:Uncharacterized protein n=1 Tax=Dreissena polymorpha TaxID=45954 RepID=A0A9D4HHL3_DREPO|nr:hypothetical protein DPMN_061901 [Dreissena polymorpha]
MLENEQEKVRTATDRRDLVRSATNRYDQTTNPLRSGTMKYDATRIRTIELRIHYGLVRNAYQKENMQAAATARNRNNVIIRVWGRVYLLHPKPRAGSS